MKKKISLTFVFFLISVLQLLAQDDDPGDPGDCTDPDACPVPLDNWVIVLVIVSLVFATIYLHRKQKRDAMLS